MAVGGIRFPAASTGPVGTRREDAHTPLEDSHEARRRVLNGICLLVAMVFFWVLTPFVTLTGIVQATRGFDVPILGWHFGGVAIVTAISMGVPLVLQPQPRSRADLAMMASLFVANIIQLIVALLAWQGGHFEGEQHWLWLIGTAVVISGVLTVTTWPQVIHHRSDGGGPIASLDYLAQSTARQELNAALGRLASRGLISSEDATRALTLPLGELGTTFGSTRDSYSNS